MLLVAEPVLGADEKAALARVIDSGWITMGERVAAFERAFSKAHGAAESVAVNSCTAGLHLVLEALGIGPGDEVLAPSLTFVATINCIRYVGATPVFVDIESLDWPLMSLASAAALRTSKTKAVILVHYAGNLAHRQAWRSFAEAHKLFLIEDAAHCAGAAAAGSFGDAAVFSFYGNKNMTTAEGGMVTARDPNVLETIRRLRGHGMTSGTFKRFSDRTVGYDVTMLGYNYRMDELRAAIGLVQLENLAAWNDKRAALVQRYREGLRKHCPSVGVPFDAAMPDADLTSVHHIMPIVLPEEADRSAVIERLRDAGIQTSNHYPPAHCFSYYRKCYPAVRLALTEEFARREITLPLHPRIEPDQVNYVVQSLADALIP